MLNLRPLAVAGASAPVRHFQTSLKRKSHLLASAAVALVLFGTSAFATTTYDTTPSWIGGPGDPGAGAISPFGNNPEHQTFGQTFVAPTDNVLQDFTFYIQGLGTEGGTDFPTLVFQAGVMAWSGPLIGPGGQATGSALFTSAVPITDTGDGSFHTISISTGGVTLTAGAQYVAFLTISGPDGSDTGSASGTDFLGFVPFDHPAGDGGGGVVFDDNPTFAGLTSALWTTDPLSDVDGDLAWTADFTSSGVALPEPAPLALIGLGLVGFGLFRRRRDA